jgi:RNA polymerase sigma factor (sigma-70 family)
VASPASSSAGFRPRLAAELDAEGLEAERRRFERERADPARLFELYADDIYRFCRASGCSPADAEDVTADVFAQALGKLGSLRWRRKPVVAFLYTIAGRRVADLGRRAGREQPAVELDTSSHDPDRHVASALRTGLAALGERERIAVVLRVVNGYSFEEVAAAIGSSEKAAKGVVYRALRKLETVFDEQGVER